MSYIRVQGRAKLKRKFEWVGLATGWPSRLFRQPPRHDRSRVLELLYLPRKAAGQRRSDIFPNRVVVLDSGVWGSGPWPVNAKWISQLPVALLPSLHSARRRSRFAHDQHGPTPLHSPSHSTHNHPLRLHPAYFAVQSWLLMDASMHTRTFATLHDLYPVHRKM